MSGRSINDELFKLNLSSVKQQRTPNKDTGMFSFHSTPGSQTARVLDSTIMSKAMDIARQEMKTMYEKERQSVDNKFYENEVQIRIQLSEMTLQKNYDKKLRKFEKDLKEAMQSFQHRQSMLEGALEESRREMAALTGSYVAREQSLLAELNLVNSRSNGYKKDLLEVQQERYYHKKWQAAAGALSECVLKLCSSVSTPVLLGRNKYSLGLGPSAAFAFKGLEDFTKDLDEEENVEEITVNKKLLKRCSKMATKIHQRLKLEEEDILIARRKDENLFE